MALASLACDPLVLTFCASATVDRRIRDFRSYDLQMLRLEVQYVEWPAVDAAGGTLDMEEHGTSQVEIQSRMV